MLQCKHHLYYEPHQIQQHYLYDDLYLINLLQLDQVDIDNYILQYLLLFLKFK
jgi:hypothetical protein